MEATLSSKGQATIPKAVRERLHLKPGDRFKSFFHPDGVIILPKIPTSRLKGIIPKPARPVSLDEIDAAIEAGATQRGKRNDRTRYQCPSAILSNSISFADQGRPTSSQKIEPTRQWLSGRSASGPILPTGRSPSLGLPLDKESARMC